MASQDLKQRIRDEPDATATAAAAADINDKASHRPGRKKAMAKRGLRSLAVAVALPLALTALDISFFGSDPASRKHLRFPPLWALHATCLVSSMLLGLSAWLVWAEGGFHRKPEALALYAAVLGLGLGWDPIVFGAGASKLGLVVALALFGSLFGCYKKFKEVSTIAGDLVKLCFAWAGFVCIVNLKLVAM
ncbi:translocator protein homolog [Punica granatum]|uniref:Translocator protein homolog n=1 Tax=Punica granatum TaxID=22663 RepID=A0A6P8DVJ5_PUNGR|nr:translocator protein homolog [Punica granatum]XP_031402041.1 translocator protein homolog [Punica granatum]